MKHKIGAACLVAFVGAIVGANYLTEHYGMVAVGFGLTATAGTFAAGAALLLRDLVQDALGWRWALAGILAGASLTALISPALAVASAVAFLLAELADMGVYTPLRRSGWARAATASGIVGAVVDTLIFLWLAGFALTAGGIGGQLTGKILWATLVPVALALAVQAMRRRTEPDAVLR